VLLIDSSYAATDISSETKSGSGQRVKGFEQPGVFDRLKAVLGWHPEGSLFLEAEIQPTPDEAVRLAILTGLSVQLLV
jgi:hypothetical protein